MSHHHRSTLAKSSLSLLFSQQRPSFTRSYAALVHPHFSLRKLHSETHLREFQKDTNPLPILRKFLNVNKGEEDVVSEWKEFYTRARAVHNKGPYRGGPVDFSKDSQILAEIERVESYNFPKDGDPELDAACEALSDALQNAGKANVEHDTPEVKQALGNLQNAYHKAAKSNTVLVRYIDVEVPTSPDSPLRGGKPKRMFLARSWMRGLISELRDQVDPILVVGDPGSGKSFGLPCL